MPHLHDEDVTVTVRESDREVYVPDSSHIDGLILEDGDRVIITATGEIYAGVAFTGKNGPSGWNASWSSMDPKWPLPGFPPYSLIGRIDGGRDGWFYIGDRKEFIVTNVLHDGRLRLRTNDDRPGNGDGAFECRVQVIRHVQRPVRATFSGTMTLRFATPAIPGGRFSQAFSLPMEFVEHHAEGKAIHIGQLPQLVIGPYSTYSTLGDNTTTVTFSSSISDGVWIPSLRSITLGQLVYVHHSLQVPWPPSYSEDSRAEFSLGTGRPTIIPWWSDPAPPGDFVVEGEAVDLGTGRVKLTGLQRLESGLLDKIYISLELQGSITPLPPW